MKPLFCFIDDARFELDNFERHAAPAFEGVAFIYASTFGQAQALLGDRLPLCFLLDIYGLDPAAGAGEGPGLPSAGELAAALEPETPPTAFLAALYQDLPPGGEGGNLFLRRLYAQVERWQGAFALAAGCLGQSRAYGLHNLAQVREAYPWAVALGYSRKALYADGVAFCQAGADGLLQKPQGQGDQAIAQATRAEAPALARAARAAVERRLLSQASALAARLRRQGSPLAEALLDGLALLLAPGAGQRPGGGAGEVGEELKAFHDADLDLASPDRALALALGQWLNSFWAAP